MDVFDAAHLDLEGVPANVPLHLQFWDTVLHLVSQLELHCAVKDLCHVVGVPAKGLWWSANPMTLAISTHTYPVIRKLEWIAPISKSKSSCFPEMNLPASMESLSIPRQFSSRYTLRKAVQCMRSCTKLRNLQKIALQMQDLKQSEVWFWSSEFGFRPKFLAQNVPFLLCLPFNYVAVPF